MKQLTINGMHCDACKKLIMMELEDAGLESAVSDLTVGSDNTGILTLADDAVEQDVEKIKEIITAMDDYDVI